MDTSICFFSFLHDMRGFVGITYIRMMITEGTQWVKT
jgi:hypothetical protein